PANHGRTAAISVAKEIMAESLAARVLENDPEKACPALDAGCVAVFGKRSCSKKKLERDDDSKKSHHALRPTSATRPPARPSRSSLGTNENGGPLAPFGAAHVAVAVRGRGARRAEGGNGDLVLVAAAPASIGRAIETPQRRRRRAAILLRSLFPAFAPL